MLLATESLLIGSFAANLRGVLPAWRKGHVGDLDLVATRRAAGALMTRFDCPMVEHVPNRCYRIDRAGGVNMDIDLRGSLIASVILWTDLMDVRINGIVWRCLVAKPPLIAALRAASVDVVEKSRAKAQADTDAYAAMGIVITPDLALAARLFRKPE